MLPPVHRDITLGGNYQRYQSEQVTESEWQSEGKKRKSVWQQQGVSPADRRSVLICFWLGDSQTTRQSPVTFTFDIGQLSPWLWTKFVNSESKRQNFWVYQQFALSSFESSSSPSTSRSHQHQIGPKMIGWFTRIRITDSRSPPFLWILPLSTSCLKTFLAFLLPNVTSPRFRSKCFWAPLVYHCPLVSAQSLLSR